MCGVVECHDDKHHHSYENEGLRLVVVMGTVTCVLHASGVLWADNNIHTHTHTHTLSLSLSPLVFLSLTLSNVFEMYLNIVIPVRSAVLMPATKCMEYLVQYNTLALTAPAN